MPGLRSDPSASCPPRRGHAGPLRFRVAAGGDKTRAAGKTRLKISAIEVIARAFRVFPHFPRTVLSSPNRKFPNDFFRAFSCPST